MAKEQNENFEAQLFKAADKLRKNIDAAEYKNIALGLVFLKYISESFQELYDKLDADEYSDPEDRDEYKAENIFFVPEQARWRNIEAKAKLPTIGQDLRNAMGVYTASGGEGKAVLDIAEVIAGMKTKFEIVNQMFHGFDYQAYFSSDNTQKLTILLGATNFILKDETLKNRFLSESTALSKLFSMSVPSFESEQIRDEVAFFQAVKARINKFTPSGGKTDKQVETAIRQIVDDALASDGVVDIFEAAGVKSPSLDILSEEFLLEVKNMEQKNLAFELLKKLLNDEVKVRKRKNMAQGKKFSEMLENVIKRYHNNQIDTAQVIQELSEIARSMKIEDKKAEDIGLTPEEYAFYSVLAENDSTSFLDEHKMKELIHIIVDTIRKNATVDWEKREDVRAKLRLTVKKILMKYGYPPDLARLEADRVLEQGELLASELMSE